MLAPVPPLLIGEDQAARPGGGALAKVTAEVALALSGAGTFFTGSANRTENHANFGSGTVYLARWLFIPTLPGAVVGITHRLDLGTFVSGVPGSDIPIWSGSIAFTGGNIDKLVQFTHPDHGTRQLAIAFTSSSSWGGSYALELIAIRGATAWSAVSTLKVLTNTADPLWGVIRNGGTYSHAFYAGAGVGPSVPSMWGVP